MLIIPLLAVSFLSKVAVLAAPIPLIVLNARASSLNDWDDVLFSRSGRSHESAPSSTFAWIISRHFDSIEGLGLTNGPRRRGRGNTGTFT